MRSVVLACATGGIPVDHGAAAAGPAAQKAAARPSAQVTAAPGAQRVTPSAGEHPAIGERLLQLDSARAYLYRALGTFGDGPSDAEFMRILTEATVDGDAIRRLDFPVLLIAGELERLMAPALLRSAATWLKNSKVVELPGLGHSPYFEDSSIWNAVVENFLTRQH